jgi:hypothetical protein
MRFMVAVIFLLASATGRADSNGSDKVSASAWGMPQLMQSMAEVKSAKHKFTERKYMSVLTAPLESSGTLLYEAPGRLEKRTLAPKEESMVLNQGVLVIESKARHIKRTMMVNQYPAMGAFVESIRATLAGDLKTLGQYFQVKLQGNAARWHLQLIPNDQATREVVREIRMEGRGKLIDSVEIFEANGDRSVMTVVEGTTITGRQL